MAFRALSLTQVVDTGPLYAYCVGVGFETVESNLRDSFRVLAVRRPSGEVREYPGVSIASAGVVFQMFNAAFFSAPVPDEAELERRIALAAVHFKARGLDWAWWVCEDWIHERLRGRLRHVFRNQRLRLSVEMPGMIAERINPPVRPLPPITIRPVRDAGTRNDFCAVGSVCFNVPPAWFREVFDTQQVWERFSGFVGYMDGEPVSTAATVIGAGAVGVYNVATLPGHQRHGCGEAIMRYALDRAREATGLERSVLQSTTQGFPLYCRMGYRTVTKVAVYAS